MFLHVNVGIVWYIIIMVLVFNILYEVIRLKNGRYGNCRLCMKSQLAACIILLKTVEFWI